MLIEVQGLSKRYRPRGPMVVVEVSFSIDRGETLAIFGDSGSGKSTIGQILAGIYPATAGEVRLDGQRLSYPLRGPARRRIQILFQHPEVAFNPKLRLIDSMREPYRLFHLPYTRQGLCDYLELYVSASVRRSALWRAEDWENPYEKCAVRPEPDGVHLFWLV